MRPSRRDLVRLLGGLLGSVATAALAQSAPPPPAVPPRDRGIGGTGNKPEEGDRGIGGTGVIGTIRRFGSIYVNGLRIAYRPDVVVTIDGALARAEDLRVGQVVRTIATGRDGNLSTRAIAVESEVVGRVSSLSGDGMTVLGQTVSLAGVPQAGVALGQRVAVHGQRRPDGVIVASLVEGRDTGPDRVAGPIRPTTDGLKVGDLILLDANPVLAGGRAVVEGRIETGGFAVSRAVPDRAPFASAVSRLSLEGYVERGPAGGVRLSSGFDVAGLAPRSLPTTGSALAVIGARRGPDGRQRVEAVRVDRSVQQGSDRAGARDGAGRPGRDGATPRPSDPAGRGGGPERRGSERGGIDRRGLGAGAGREPGGGFGLGERRGPGAGRFEFEPGLGRSGGPSQPGLPGGIGGGGFGTPGGPPPGGVGGSPFGGAGPGGGIGGGGRR